MKAPPTTSFKLTPFCSDMVISEVFSIYCVCFAHNTFIVAFLVGACVIFCCMAENFVLTHSYV